MTINIFGKDGCLTCKGIKNKIDIFLRHWNISDKVVVVYYSASDAVGLTKAMMVGIEPPAVTIEEDNKEIARWQGTVLSKDLKPYLDKIINEAKK